MPSPRLAQTVEERQRATAGRQNFGFSRVERLAGNIGYLDLRGFMPVALAGNTATAAVTFLANSDAVIFDLRQNGGGDPNMVAFLTSYLVGPQPVHLHDFYSRPMNETRQSWTFAFVPGPRLTDLDVYVLTSSRTFSGAEEFTYNLKQLKRATVVGETTGGGAHPVSGRRLPGQFAMAVPTGRPINAVSKSNWEGVGVEPDVKVAAEQALRAAHLIALENQQRRLTADMAGLRNEVSAAIPRLREEPRPPRGCHTDVGRCQVGSRLRGQRRLRVWHARRLACRPERIGRLVHLRRREGAAGFCPDRPGPHVRPADAATGQVRGGLGSKWPRPVHSVS